MSLHIFEVADIITEFISIVSFKRILVLRILNTFIKSIIDKNFHQILQRFNLGFRSNWLTVIWKWKKKIKLSKFDRLKYKVDKYSIFDLLEKGYSYQDIINVLVYTGRLDLLSREITFREYRLDNSLIQGVMKQAILGQQRSVIEWLISYDITEFDEDSCILYSCCDLDFILWITGKIHFREGLTGDLTGLVKLKLAISGGQLELVKWLFSNYNFINISQHDLFTNIYLPAIISNQSTILEWILIQIKDNSLSKQYWNLLMSNAVDNHSWHMATWVLLNNPFGALFCKYITKSYHNISGMIAIKNYFDILPIDKNPIEDIDYNEVYELCLQSDNPEVITWRISENVYVSNQTVLNTLNNAISSMYSEIVELKYDLLVNFHSINKDRLQRSNVYDPETLIWLNSEDIN